MNDTSINDTKDTLTETERDEMLGRLERAGMIHRANADEISAIALEADTLDPGDVDAHLQEQVAELNAQQEGV